MTTTTALDSSKLTIAGFMIPFLSDRVLFMHQELNNSVIYSLTKTPAAAATTTITILPPPPTTKVTTAAVIATAAPTT